MNFKKWCGISALTVVVAGCSTSEESTTPSTSSHSTTNQETRTQESAKPSTVDYRAIHQATMTQESAKTFVMACGRLREDVKRNGLTNEELRSSGAHTNNIVDTGLSYDFEHLGNGLVVGTCSVTGTVMDNAFRYIQFEVRNYQDTYTISY